MPDAATGSRGRRRVRYQVAVSLDGYIAGPNGEVDWIVADPGIDFAALLEPFDTVLMGRRSWEETDAHPGMFPGMRVVVCSRTLRAEDHPGVTVAGDAAAAVDALRSGPGKDIWLFGGGELFRSLLELDRVDTVEPAIVPVVLGGGRPLLPAPAVRRRLKLAGHQVYPSGIVLLRYDVAPRGDASG
ncbi:MAG: dihydrofolate reductase [Gemmatimonadetes bacterium]|nr:dihydrofolate reductase [Gemmatimonadota bacterium]NIQ57276.1 dihydrofolate reductase [Gemmatimonadota bacterium]NIU77441.1 dihydrofolate reductase [Gammaproteobacteria bacterium]NIX46673.1 dihydrofolate reductase [Gemmatimonadota bacterium]NIY11016.1 dihydrofolate reductase [Gemmatimonadota bacterium]